MLRVHQKPDEIIAVQVQPKQYTASDVIDSAVHGTIHRFGMICVIVLRPGRMEFFVSLLVIGFLKQDIGSDSRFFEFAVVLDRGRRNIHIDAADRTVFMFDSVDRPDAFQNVFDRVVHRILARFKSQALMPHVLQRNHLPHNLLLRELLAADMLVFQMIRTVGTSVDTVI